MLLLFFLPLLALLPWRWWQKVVPVASVPPLTPANNNGILTNDDLQILGHVYEVITNTQDGKSTNDAMLFMQEFLMVLPRSSGQELKLGLIVLEKVLPLFIGELATFSKLTFDKKVAVMNWLKNAPNILYPLFLGLKELSYLAHYRLEKEWDLIDYAGPVVERGYDNPDFNREYDVLLALTPKQQKTKGTGIQL